MLGRSACKVIGSGVSKAKKRNSKTYTLEVLFSRTISDSIEENQSVLNRNKLFGDFYLSLWEEVTNSIYVSKAER